jgi:hypothetical protein
MLVRFASGNVAVVINNIGDVLKTHVILISFKSRVEIYLKTSYKQNLRTKVYTTMFAPLQINAPAIAL